MAVGSKSRSNLAIGSLYYHWNHIWAVGSTWAWSRPSDHAAWRKGKIAKKLAIYLRLVADISVIYCHQKRFFHKIANLSPRADISLIYRRFLQKYLSFNFSSRNIVSTLPDTRYIADISRHFPPWLPQAIRDNRWVKRNVLTWHEPQAMKTLYVAHVQCQNIIEHQKYQTTESLQLSMTLTHRPPYSLISPSSSPIQFYHWRFATESFFILLSGFSVWFSRILSKFWFFFF